MAGQIPRSFIDDLLNRIDIVDVIDARVKLKKSGSNHSACCPFHAEKTPSFTVSQSKQFYHCFGCGAHGSALGFLMEYDGMHFIDAVETLAESVGLEVPRESGQPDLKRDRHKPLYALMEECASYFSHALKNSEAAIDYLKNRGLVGETARQFGIGYAPAGWDTLLKQFPEREKDLVETGMLTKNDKGRVYDRFRDRIMFPIRDRRGRVIAFGGRVLENAEPKYLNSPETPIYHKGSELYGLFEGRKSAQDAAQVIVVEGYMDVIALAQHGIGNAVATLGTATNQQHVENIYRVAPEILFCFDGDRAGVDAAWRALNATLPCLQDGRDAYFLFLEQGQDPDSLVTELGKQGFVQQLERKRSIIDFLFEHLKGDADLSQIGTRARLVEEATPLLKKIPAGVYKRLAQQKLENLVGMALDAAPANTQAPSRYQQSARRKDANTSRRHSARPGPSHFPNRTAKGGGQSRGMTPMRRAILLLLNYPQLAHTLPPEQYDFDPAMRGAKLLLKIIALVDRNPDISIGSLVEQFRESADWQAIDILSATPYFPDARELTLEVATAEFAHCIELLNKQSLPREASKLPVHARTGLLGLKSNSDQQPRPRPDSSAAMRSDEISAAPVPDYPEAGADHTDWDITHDNSHWDSADPTEDNAPDSGHPQRNE